jgi:hypothetical protein
VTQTLTARPTAYCFGSRSLQADWYFGLPFSDTALRGQEQSVVVWSLSTWTVHAAVHAAGGGCLALTIPTDDCALVICQPTYGRISLVITRWISLWINLWVKLGMRHSSRTPVP